MNLIDWVASVRHFSSSTMLFLATEETNRELMLLNCTRIPPTWWKRTILSSVSSECKCYLWKRFGWSQDNNPHMTVQPRFSSETSAAETGDVSLFIQFCSISLPFCTFCPQFYFFFQVKQQQDISAATCRCHQQEAPPCCGRIPLARTLATRDEQRQMFRSVLINAPLS